MWLKYAASYHGLQGLVQYLCICIQHRNIFFLYGNKEAQTYGQASYRSGPSILAEEIKILTNIIS